MGRISTKHLILLLIVYVTSLHQREIIIIVPKSLPMRRLYAVTGNLGVRKLIFFTITLWDTPTYKDSIDDEKKVFLISLK